MLSGRRADAVSALSGGIRLGCAWQDRSQRRQWSGPGDQAWRLQRQQAYQGTDCLPAA